MIIGIDITPVTHTPTGIGMYTRHLIHELAAMACPDIFMGFAAGIRPLDRAHIPFPHRRIPLPSRLLFEIWERTGRPFADRILGGLEVFHAVNYTLPPLKKARGIITIHDLGFLRDPDWFSPKILKPFRRSILRHAQRAETIIAVSEATAADVSEQLGIDRERIRVIYEAADKSFHPIPRDLAAQRVKDALHIEGPYALFVGTVEARKNVTGLLAAFSKAKMPHTLVIAGGYGWRSGEILAFGARLGLAERLRFTGYIPDRTLFPFLYSAADLFVFPSWHEGFGLPVLEAMACGCPVITSGTSSLPEVGGEAALYVEPADVDGLTRKMEAVAGDADLRAVMAGKGLERSRLFSWRQCAEETLACYHRET
ncbi:MAG: N-acetylgalactosamine-N,N'-diacetylbacillosaminyl-diphospho-undecaprenol 4-alpha-N-acetylgalactosaminyltransferase [Candidatus Hydrogenedentes bacterium ADurb.Bin101]|nr:MAG: N-acetylgalactosamine-N,N'-diacetylbacillosaminyl-diphospho-undecaprenol 4-alpha-N-acetylgalactosaminyltransferase [Candidatus Hydrogenedentes bacterium ADurb.Bin101]HOC68431.1 glycosyltransferase family 1 protein [Candidatus Hydrogenedentota bacterium]